MSAIFTFIVTILVYRKSGNRFNNQLTVFINVTFLANTLTLSHLDHWADGNFIFIGLLTYAIIEESWVLSPKFVLLNALICIPVFFVPAYYFLGSNLFIHVAGLLFIWKGYNLYLENKAFHDQLMVRQNEAYRATISRLNHEFGNIVQIVRGYMDFQTQRPENPHAKNLNRCLDSLIRTIRQFQITKSYSETVAYGDKKMAALSGDEVKQPL